MNVIANSRYEKVKEAVEEQEGWFTGSDVVKTAGEAISKNNVHTHLKYLFHCGLLQKRYKKGKHGYRKTGAWDGD